MNQMVRAVITGDIIQSTQMDVAMRGALVRRIKAQLRIWDRDFNMASEIFRGDSFQCLLKNPKQALRAALVIKTFIRGLNPSQVYDATRRGAIRNKKILIRTNWIFDTRIGIGLGTINQRGGLLANSNGPAFHLSGHALDEMKNSKNHIAIKVDDFYAEEWNTEFVMLDALISKTSALQCQVLMRKLLNHTEIRIAQKLGVGQSAVNQRSVSGNWNAIHTMVKRFEKVYENG